ncbi:unnamed protein product, partial [Allacma fusca]
TLRVSIFCNLGGLCQATNYKKTLKISMLPFQTPTVLSLKGFKLKTWTYLSNKAEMNRDLLLIFI